MIDIIDLLYQKQFRLCATYPLDDSEGFIYYLGEIQKAISAVKRLNEMYKLIDS